MNRTRRLTHEARRWSIYQEALPRELFPRLRFPIMFARFEKVEARRLVGFALFADLDAMRWLSARTRRILADGAAPVWRAVVLDALQECGGEATLATLYRAIEGRRPSTNQHWRAKVRQQVQHHCVRVAPATYRLPSR
jgi:site-specific DNA-methyltransferase (adenine-specific)